jgi:hypothetical protein
MKLFFIFSLCLLHLGTCHEQDGSEDSPALTEKKLADLVGMYQYWLLKRALASTRPQYKQESKQN